MARASSRLRRGVRANAGVEARYRRRLDTLITEMNRSIAHWIGAAYRSNPPLMAQDALPARELNAAVRALRRRWMQRFDEAAPELAKWFLQRVDKRSTAQLHQILHKGGFTVKFQATPAQRDVLAASISENVALIKSIPSQHFDHIEGLVMRSVTAGRDLATLTRQLQHRFGATRARATLIARDQNNKATSALSRAKQLDLGLDSGIWRHSHAGKEPRPKHVAAYGKKFDLRKGMKVGDKGQWVMPGEEINCRCYWVPMVPGF